MKRDPVRMGLRAAISPVPMLIAAVLITWFLFFNIGIGLLGYTSVPTWISLIMALLLLISPVRCIVSLVYGMIHRREKRAWLGILLSAVGLAENILLLYGMFWLGSRY